MKKIEIHGQVGSYNWSFGNRETDRSSIINHLIKKYNLKSYLEIGVRDGRNFNRIYVDESVGVDPNLSPYKNVNKPNSTLVNKTSDEYFKNLDRNFDIIFIDGLHLEEQTTKDIVNSMNHLNENGFLIMHDCNPPTKFHQRDNYCVNGRYPSWNGTVWKAYAKKRMSDPNLNMYVVNTDWGVGVIQKGTQELYPKIENLNYEYLEKNRKKLLNLISVEEFLELEFV